MDLIKGVTSDHDLIKLAKLLEVNIDNIYESSEITKPLPKVGTFLILLSQPNMDVGHWTCVDEGIYFDSMGEGSPKKYGINKYFEMQRQGTRADYCGIFCLLFLYCKQHSRMDLLKSFNNLNIVVL